MARGKGPAHFADRWLCWVVAARPSRAAGATRALPVATLSELGDPQIAPRFCFGELVSPAPPDMPTFFTGKRKLLFAVLLLLSFAQVGFGIAAAGAVSKLFAGLSQGAALDSFAVATLVAAVMAIGSAEFGRRWTTEALGLDYAHTVRMVLFERLLRRPYRRQLAQQGSRRCCLSSAT